MWHKCVPLLSHCPTVVLLLSLLLSKTCFVIVDTRDFNNDLMIDAVFRDVKFVFFVNSNFDRQNLN